MLSLLLHMHQPDYRDPESGVPVMPWTRLHMLRGYTDVPTLVRETGARVTLNLVPSLVAQWQHYVRGGSDPWRDLVAKPAQALTPEEARWALGNLVAGHPAAFRWFPRWGELRARRDAGAHFSTEDLRDLQVWSVLAWFGATALREHPALGLLRAKARGFTEADKGVVLDAEAQILAALPSRWQGLPEVSATPLYHPILPLLVDSAHARRCMPDVPDPGFRAPEDALHQLVEGRRAVEAFAGAPVTGLWPSEGSVSPEVLALARQAGFVWAATDEGVLARSDGERTRPGGRPHHGVWHDASGLRVLFRDREASDRIGFVYQTWDGVAAAKDLLARLPKDGPVLLALDGENPWEGYEDAGEGFLRALFAQARTQTCGEMAAATPSGTIARIHTGSWIDADFRIWIGHPEDRAAWRLLADARRAWVQAGRPEAAREHLLAAEGSDWFWWFGDDFSTPFAHLFDRLFRLHLAAVYRVIGQPLPEGVRRPVRQASPAGLQPPVARLPEEDGEDWFAWAGAGELDLRAGAMAPSPGTPRQLLFGARGGRLALRLVPATPGASTRGWTAVADHVSVPFLDERATLPGDVDAIVLCGPAGERLPADGSYVLPWRTHLPSAPR